MGFGKTQVKKVGAWWAPQQLHESQTEASLDFVACVCVYAEYVCLFFKLMKMLAEVAHVLSICMWLLKLQAIELFSH